MINIITAISMVTVCIITAALVILLSAFNGLESKIEELFSAFDPDLKVAPLTGKTIPVNQEILQQVKNTEGIQAFTQVIDESVLFVYNGQQYIGKIKGVEDSFLDMVRMDTLVYSGQPLLKSGKARFAILGEEIAAALDINVDDPTRLLTIYYPKRGKLDLFSPFRDAAIMPGGVFAIQQEFNQYAIVPIEMARLITRYEDEVTGLEIKLTAGADERKVKRELRNIFKDQISVKNRYEQQELMFKVLKSEKFAMFLIVTLILVIASFNLISALTMLIVEKKKDIMVLWSLGATFKKVKQIYVAEGTLVALIGASVGMVIGVAVVLLQYYLGFVKLGDGPDAQDYPVVIKIPDLCYIFITVVLIGFLASWLRMKSVRLGRSENVTLIK